MHGVGEWFGWVGALLGTFGSLLLARPLFILLRHREAVESLIHALETPKSADELAEEFTAAKATLSAKIFQSRKIWKRWAYGGVTFLCFSILFLVAQALWTR
jgi:hypothetical protein